MDDAVDEGQGDLYVVEISGRAGEDLSEFVLAIDPAYVGWDPEDTGAARFELYLQSRAEADRAAEEAGTAVAASGLKGVTVGTRTLAGRDWKESWKEFFHARRVSDRIVVRPPWEEFPARRDDRVVTIDPGMSFGTGLHATTRACLVFLDEMHARGRVRSFLDIGCGSGILAIAAAKLEISDVLAVDIDPDAVNCALVNAAANGVDSRFVCRAADLAFLSTGRRYDLVAANILAPVLVEQAAKVSGLSRGLLALAGVLSSQYQDVLAAYAAHGFHEVRRIDEAEWSSGLLAVGDGLP